MKILKSVGRTLIVRRKPPKTELKGFLIVLPENQVYYNKECEVLVISEFAQKMYPDLKVGDTVLVLEYAGIQIDPHEDPWLLSIRWDEVICQKV